MRYCVSCSFYSSILGQVWLDSVVGLPSEKTKSLMFTIRQKWFCVSCAAMYDPERDLLYVHVQGGGRTSGVDDTIPAILAFTGMPCVFHDHQNSWITGTK